MMQFLNRGFPDSRSLTVILLLLFLAAFAITQGSGQAPHGELIEFPEMIDLGELKAGEVCNIKFEVRNLTEDALEITTRADCSCMSVHPEKVAAAPRELILFEVTINAPSKTPGTAVSFEKLLLFECRGTGNSKQYSTVIHAVKNDPVIIAKSSMFTEIESGLNPHCTINLELAEHVQLESAWIEESALFHLTKLTRDGRFATLYVTSQSWIEPSTVEADIVGQIRNTKQSTEEVNTVNLRLPVHIIAPVSVSPGRLILCNGLPSDEITFRVRVGHSLVHVAPSEVPVDFRFENVGPRKYRFAPLHPTSQLPLAQNTASALAMQQVPIIVTILTEGGIEKTYRLPFQLLSAGYSDTMSH